MSERFYRSLSAFGLACIVALTPISHVATAAAGANTPATIETNAGAAVAAGEAERALAEGTALVRRNRADQALPLLESALRLFTQANNRSGLAAAHDALGDIYLRHGQYPTALEHFRSAATVFSAQNETANAALMFAKLGETYYLAGDEAAAQAAFARIGETQDERRAGAAGIGRNASGGGNNGNSRRRERGAALTFASISALLPGLGTCPSLNFNNSANNSAPQSIGAANNIAGRIVTGNSAPKPPPASPPHNPAVNPSGRTPNNPLNNRPGNPSGNPSGANPSGTSSSTPSNNYPGKPSGNPSSGGRTGNPSGSSSGNPSGKPSSNPSGSSTSNTPGKPSGNPSSNAASRPSGNPASPSANNPSTNPTGRPSNNPSTNPSNNPAGKPSTDPSSSNPNNPSNTSPRNSSTKSPNSPGSSSTNSSGNTSNKPSGNSNQPAGNSTNNEPRNMGRAPKKLDGLGRMDLRVADQNGNPIKGAKGRLSTTRPNGILCDCWEQTDAAGRAVLPAIHVGKELMLEVTAPGFESLKQIVPAEKLAEPFKVTLQSKDAAKSLPRDPGEKFAHAILRQNAATTPNLSQFPSENSALGQFAAHATNVVNALNLPDSSDACFDFYRLFIAYETSELRLARADFNSNRMASAQAHYLNVLDAADTNAPAGKLAAARLFRAVARTSLGDIALRQSRFADALKSYGQAAEIARADGRAELTWGAERGLGKTYWVMSAVAGNDQTAFKNRGDAIKHYRAALGIIETLFAGSLRADNARSSFLATTKDVFDEAAGVFAELALMDAPPMRQSQKFAHAAQTDSARMLAGQSLTYAAEAFRIVEQGKARSLLDMLGEARAEVREGVPAALLERKATNMARQQEIANLFGGVSLKSAQPKQTVPELEAELERLTREFDALENQIRTASPRYAALVRAQPLTLAEMQRQVLDDATVLLEYNLGVNQSYLFAATKTGLTLYRLPSRATVERQAIELRQQLIPAGTRRAIAGINVESTTRGLALGSPSTASANVRAYVSAANALYQTIVAPASAQVGDKRVLVVPDGALNYVPFESLVTNTTQGIDYSTLAYLIKSNEIVYAPSASVVAAIRQGARRGAAGRGGMLLVADPVFDASDERLNNSSQGASRARASVQRLSLASALEDVTNLKGGDVKLARLDGTRFEAGEIAKLARSNGGQADVWLDFEASEAKLQERKLDGYGVLHFATHGLLDAERPQFTGLALSLVGQTDGDGFLRVDEVFNLRLGSPLVMLSACETGLGKERRGEGVIGLTRAFMYAGAPTVGVSLWSVADKSTAELMPEFYRRLLAGQGAGGGAPAAMRAAQLSLIAGKRYSAPFYWAPFVLVGDWR